jgi:hypothetical protein
MARDVRTIEASTVKVVGRARDLSYSHVLAESSKNLTIQFLLVSVGPPLALPSFFRYFPPAVAKVYIVSFRTHDDRRPSKFIVLADKYASGHARIRTHPTYSLIPARHRESRLSLRNSEEAQCRIG